MDKLSRTDECITIGRFKVNPFLFADDSVLLASLESGLQHALNGFTAAACDIAEIKISTSNIPMFSFAPFSRSKTGAIEKGKTLGVKVGIRAHPHL